MMKRLLTVLCVAACVLCLLSCDRYEPPALDPEKPTAFAGEDIFYCNGIQAFDREGILLPDFEVQSSVSSRYGIALTYQNVTPLQMSVYRAQMKNAGFSLVETEYHTYFYSDTCFVGTSYTKDLSTGEVQLWWYTKSGDAPDGGLGADAAKQRIGTDCPYTLIDVTPKGVYDAAGGQTRTATPLPRTCRTIFILSQMNTPCPSALPALPWRTLTATVRTSSGRLPTDRLPGCSPFICLALRTERSSIRPCIRQSMGSFISRTTAWGFALSISIPNTRTER